MRSRFEQITLQFITPLRLIDREHTVREARFRPLVQRLLERSLALEHYYGDQKTTMTREEKMEWLDLADAVRCSVIFEGDLVPFLDLLVLGELVHVGKKVVKGDGWYKII